MSEGDAQDVAADEAPEPQVAMAETQAPMGAMAGEIRFRAGEGRRVRLVRDEGGGYAIFMGDRCIQSFCREWEDVTRYPLPTGIEQQVQIIINPLGEAREAREVAQSREERIRQLQEAHPSAILRPHPETVHPADHELIRMFNELPPHNREIIAGQIRANWANTHSIEEQEHRATMRHVTYGQPEEVQLTNIAHPRSEDVSRPARIGEIERLVESLVLAIRQL